MTLTKRKMRFSIYAGQYIYGWTLDKTIRCFVDFNITGPNSLIPDGRDYPHMFLLQTRTDSHENVFHYQINCYLHHGIRTIPFNRRLYISPIQARQIGPPPFRGISCSWARTLRGSPEFFPHFYSSVQYPAPPFPRDSWL